MPIVGVVSAVRGATKLTNILTMVVSVRNRKLAKYRQNWESRDFEGQLLYLG